MSRQGWLPALYAAGVVPASFIPDASLRPAEQPDPALGDPAVELVEDAELLAHPVAPHAPPAVVSFLDGIMQWKVIGYDGVLPITVAYVAAAVRRRSARQLRTVAQAEREVVIAPIALMREAGRRALAGVPDLIALEGDALAQPSQLLDAIRREVHRARQSLEKQLGEQSLEALEEGAWLVVDGQVAVSSRLARHPRCVGVIKSHGAQFLQGRHLEQALTIPAAHRTSVFRVSGGHGRTEVDSWYLRLWPWAGKDLHYGLIRVEARADVSTVTMATTVSGWLLGERAPLAAPDARFDRLLYPIHDVETYLRARAPRDLLPQRVSRLPRTGS